MGWLALLGPLIPVLVNAAEKLFGPKTGTVKGTTVTSQIETIAQALATAGKLNGPAPTLAEIAAEVALIAGQMFPPGVSNPTNIGSPVVANSDKATVLKGIITWALTQL